MNEAYPDYPWPDANWFLIPPHMRTPVYEFVMNGRRIGDFLVSVIADDPVSEVFAKADDSNQRAMLGWIIFLSNYFPARARRSRENIKNWIESGGVLGQKGEGK